jgi:hypothetical protein
LRKAAIIPTKPEVPITLPAICEPCTAVTQPAIIAIKEIMNEKICALNINLSSL